MVDHGCFQRPRQSDGTGRAASRWPGCSCRARSDRCFRMGAASERPCHQCDCRHQPRGTVFGRSLLSTRSPHPAYPQLAEERERRARRHGTQAGDPDRAAAAIIAAMDSDLPPGRLVLGRSAYHSVKVALVRRLDELEQWRSATLAADYAD
jgi:hypothetical protein